MTVEHACTVQLIHHAAATRSLAPGSQAAPSGTLTQWVITCPACPGDATVRGGTRAGVDMYVAQHHAQHHGTPPAPEQPAHAPARTMRYARGWHLGLWCSCGAGWRGPDSDAHAALATHLAECKPPADMPAPTGTQPPRRLR